MRRDAASAGKGRVAANWMKTNTVEVSIASAMNRRLPSRAITEPAPTR